MLIVLVLTHEPELPGPFMQWSLSQVHQICFWRDLSSEASQSMGPVMC